MDHKSNRRDGSKNVGFVNFPVHLENTGEGGMSVYFVVDGEHSVDDKGIPSNFSMNTESNLVMLHYACMPNEQEDLFNESADPIGYLYAALCIGSSGGSWYDSGAEKYWTASHDHLTPEGKQLHSLLQSLYLGRKIKILTVLDT